MTTYLDPDQLRRNLSALDDETLRARVAGGQLTPEAHAIALEVLKARKQDIGLPLAPPVPACTDPVVDRPSYRHLVDRLLVAYLLLVIACAVVVMADPPWVAPHGGGWQGTFGYLAGLVAGLPWTIVAARTVMTGTAFSFWTWTILAVVANLVGLAFLRRRTE